MAYESNVVQIEYITKHNYNVNKKLKCSNILYEYVLNEQYARQLDELFTPQVNTMNIKAFISYCFDDRFHSRYTKPFTVSNYAQKLLNEYESSSYIKNDENLKKILRELASFANHHANDGSETYRVTLAHYIDSRILIGICLRNFLDFKLYYPPHIIVDIGNQWFDKWIDASNRDVAKEFRYDQKSHFLNYKTLIEILYMIVK